MPRTTANSHGVPTNRRRRIFLYLIVDKWEHMGPKQQNRKVICHEKDRKCDVKKVDEKGIKKKQTNPACHPSSPGDRTTSNAQHLPPLFHLGGHQPPMSAIIGLIPHKREAESDCPPQLYFYIFLFFSGVTKGSPCSHCHTWKLQRYLLMAQQWYGWWPTVDAAWGVF